VDRSMYDNASRWVANDLGIEITRSKWGQEAERQRTNASDPQIAAAVDLLRRASTPESLFALAQNAGAIGNMTRQPEPTPASR
jgi:hypothetical protein